MDAIEYISWDTDVSLARVRKWFSSDTRAALEAAIRADVKAEARQEAEKYLAQVRMACLEAIRVAAQKQLKELSPGIKVVFE